MPDVKRVTEELLAEKPSIEAGLRAVLEVDRDRDTWEFDDIPLDSGEFGEVVAQGIVEQHQGGYRLADPAAVERALAEDDGGFDVDLDLDGMVSAARLRPSIDVRATVALLGALGFLFLMRILNYPNVF